MKHKFIFWMMLAALLLTAGCGDDKSSPSEELSTPEGSLVEFSGFTFDTGTRTITKYSGTDSVVLIPWSIGDTPVEHIAAYAFEEADTVREITLSVSLQSIEPMAFADCESLTALHVPEGSEYFAEEDGVLLSKDRDTLIAYPAARPADSFNEPNSYRLPVNVSAVGDGAFYGCNLEKVYLRNISSTIGDYAFAESPNLISVSNGGLVTEVGDYAFLNCSQLQNAWLGESLTAMGVGCYQGCTGLSFGGTGLVTHIPERAFQGCSSLEQINFDAPVTSMGKDALSGCDALVGVFCRYGLDQWDIRCESPEDQERLDSLPVIFSISPSPNDPASSAYGLENGEITLIVYENDDPIYEVPEKIGGYPVTKLGGGTLITNAEQVILPKTITEIASNYFAGESCKEITVDEQNAYFTSVDGVLYTKDMTELVAYPAAKSATSFTLPDTLKTIRMHAFLSCQTLEEVILPDSLDTIGTSAFADCQALSRIHIPEGVTAICSDAFWGCKSLSEISLPSTLIGLDPSMFNGCESLETIWFGGTEEQWHDLRANPIQVSEITDSIIPVSEPLVERILNKCTVYYGQS